VILSINQSNIIVIIQGKPTDINLIYGCGWRWDGVRVFACRPAQNLLEAASNGAIAAIKVVSSVAANLIAILGLITFLNEALSYLGGCVGVPQLSFKVRAPPHWPTTNAPIYSDVDMTLKVRWVYSSSWETHRRATERHLPYEIGNVWSWSLTFGSKT